MAIIQLPSSATKEKNLLRTLDVLSKIVPEDMEKGIQLFQTTLSEPFRKQAERIAKTAKHIPDDIHSTLHAPFCAHNPERRYNLAHPEGFALLFDTCKLAEKIGCQTVVAHFNTIYAHPASGHAQSWKREWDNPERLYEEIVLPVFENIHTLSESTECNIAFENLPIPLHGDQTLDPEKIFRDPCMSNFEFLDLFTKEFKHKKNIGLCFDVSHYGLSSDLLNRELGNKTRLGHNDLLSAGTYPLYPKYIERQPNIKEAIMRLVQEQSEKGIIEIQLADYGAIWKQQTSEGGCLLEEGVGLLEGKGGIDILETAAYMAKEHPHVPLAFDIEVEDTIAMTRQIMAVLLFTDFVKNPEKLKIDFLRDREELIKNYEKKAKEI